MHISTAPSKKLLIRNFFWPNEMKKVTLRPHVNLMSDQCQSDWNKPPPSHSGKKIGGVLNKNADWRKLMGVGEQNLVPADLDFSSQKPFWCQVSMMCEAVN